MKFKVKEGQSIIEIPNSDFLIFVDSLVIVVVFAYYFLVLNYFAINSFGLFGYLLYVIIFFFYLSIRYLFKNLFQVQIIISATKINIYKKIVGFSFLELQTNIQKVNYQDSLISIESNQGGDLKIEMVEGFDHDFILINKDLKEIHIQNHDFKEVFSTIKNNLQLNYPSKSKG